jgi:hypothetical protein
MIGTKEGSLWKGMAVAEVLLFIVVVIKLIQELFDVKIHSTVVLLYICE